MPLVLAAVMVVAMPGAGSAEPLWKDYRSVVIRVPMGDLDLGRDAGADAFLRRVALAASKACGGRPAVSVVWLEEARAYKACKVQAMERAVAQVDNARVYARYAVRKGDAAPVEVAQDRQ